MQRDEICQKLTVIFKDVFKREDLVLSDDLSAADIKEWDSFSHFNLITTVEKAFGVKFGLGELQELKNVGHLVDLVESKSVSGLRGEA